VASGRALPDRERGVSGGRLRVAPAEAAREPPESDAGAVGAAFLRDVKRILEAPAALAL
jgi:hypothetical protein